MGASDKALVKELADDLVSDALASRGVPERVNYETGVLLDASDFADEQRYFRGRAARAFAVLHGHGTMAGLRVTCPLTVTDAANVKHPNADLEVRVAPGLAMDRLGRLIEVRVTQCLRIKRWLDERKARAVDDLGRLALIAAVRDAPPLLFLDVFVRFAICPHGKTPAFAAGPFNATDYVVPSRLADAFDITLEIANAVRVKPNDPGDLSTVLAAPARTGGSFADMLAALTAIADPAAREAKYRELSLQAVLDAWPGADKGDASRLPKLREHAQDRDWDKVFLARIALPVVQAAAGAFPDIDAARLADPAGTRDLADNSARPVVSNPFAWRGAA